MSKFSNGLLGAALSVGALNGCSTNPEVEATRAEAMTTVAPTYIITTPETVATTTPETSTTLISYTNSDMELVQCRPVLFAEVEPLIIDFFTFATFEEGGDNDYSDYYDRMTSGLVDLKYVVSLAICDTLFTIEDMPRVDFNDQPVGDPVLVELNGSITDSGREFSYENNTCVITAVVGDMDESTQQFTMAEIDGRSIVEVAC